MSFLNKLFGGQQPREVSKLGRNDSCWCGSGKKYKRCHIESDARNTPGSWHPAAYPGADTADPVPAALETFCNQSELKHDGSCQKGMIYPAIKAESAPLSSRAFNGKFFGLIRSSYSSISSICRQLVIFAPCLS